MKKTLTFISLACFALVFCGCLAKSKPAIKQYSLYTDKCSQIPVKITNVSSLPVLQNRNIIIADGINIKTLKDARFISFGEDMLERALLQYFGCKPSDKNSPKLSVELTELYATQKIAKVALKAKARENEVYLSANSKIENNSSDAVVLGMNSALENLLLKLEEFIKKSQNEKL